MKPSVLILTYNEEVNLPDCIASVGDWDDVVVFDSYSDDSTVEIARRRGARVFQRRFDNYADQRNAAFSEVGFRYPWVWMLDADERLTTELRIEVEAALSSVSPEVSLFRVRRKDYFRGRWLRRSSGYPTWAARLFRYGHVTVNRGVHEQFQVPGETRFLKAHFLHYPFNKGIAHWYDRHNWYSTQEAIIQSKRTGYPSVMEFLSRDPVVRRKSMKSLAYQLPMRPILAFLYLWLWRAGFLDGTPGLNYCILRATYEYMIDQKIYECRFSYPLSEPGLCGSPVPLPGNLHI